MAGLCERCGKAPAADRMFYASCGPSSPYVGFPWRAADAAACYCGKLDLTGFDAGMLAA